MRKVLILMVAAAVLCAAAMAQAATSWKGIDWDSPAGSIAVDGSGNLVVTATRYEFNTTGVYEGAAHFNTSSAFRAALTPWVEFTFIETGADTYSPAAQMWMEREGLSSDPNASWARLGVGSPSSPDYRGASYGVWWNEHTDALGRFVGSARSNGTHTALLGRRSDGKVDFVVDGSPIGTTDPATDFQPDYFGDIYLVALGLTSGETVTFTDFRMGTDYAGPVVPEPVSIFLGIMGLGSVAGFRRLRK